MNNKQETPLMRLIAELNISIEYFKSSLDFQTNEIDRGRSKLRLSQVKSIKAKTEYLLHYEREIIENFAKKYFIENRHDQQKITEEMIKENIESFFNQTFKSE